MEHDAFVPVPSRRLREALADPAQVARAVPGLQQDAGAEPVAGRLKLRVGSHSVTYRGSVRLTAREDGSYAAEGDATETRGTGSVKLALTLRVTDAEGGSTLTFEGSATADGRLTELPPESVSSALTRLLDRFAEKLGAGAGAEAAAETGEAGEPEEAGGAAEAERAGGAPATEQAAGVSEPEQAAGAAEAAQAGEVPEAAQAAGVSEPSKADAASEAESGAGVGEPGQDDGPEPVVVQEFGDKATSDFDTTPDADDEPPVPDGTVADVPADTAAAPSDDDHVSVFDTEIPPPSLDPSDEDEDQETPVAAGSGADDYTEPAEPPAEAAHARRTMIGRSAEEVDHAPPRGRYAPVPAPQTAAQGSTLRWVAPAAALVLASAIVAGRVLRRRR
ncbi:SRPBCC domain-containing protein [Streptomyces cylindrosporus]|uniref:SRPBCC family protein n=1 Tax=Streptomyces cylindrosporus TaxID=2927583 RepID=A0ABS9YCQ9_9ACTN|nr:SRPBCC domain-containing protein [Streptomyces cylindrosporus]MCI3275013.1 SRPBCC family protein [Streptomyces cylindrosporus]